MFFSLSPSISFALVIVVQHFCLYTQRQVRIENLHLQLIFLDVLCWWNVVHFTVGVYVCRSPWIFYGEKGFSKSWTTLSRKSFYFAFRHLHVASWKYKKKRMKHLPNTIVNCLQFFTSFCFIIFFMMVHGTWKRV